MNQNENWSQNRSLWQAIADTQVTLVTYASLHVFSAEDQQSVFFLEVRKISHFIDH